jgi:XTP/dITP diphosphohydrolase
VLALARPGEETVFESGAIEGEIVLDPRGRGGFGYDPYFLVPAFACTMAELPLDDKNRISHRGQAMRRMVERLRALLPNPHAGG